MPAVQADAAMANGVEVDRDERSIFFVSHLRWGKGRMSQGIGCLYEKNGMGIFVYHVVFSKAETMPEKSFKDKPKIWAFSKCVFQLFGLFLFLTRTHIHTHTQTDQCLKDLQFILMCRNCYAFPCLHVVEFVCLQNFFNKTYHSFNISLAPGHEHKHKPLSLSGVNGLGLLDNWFWRVEVSCPQVLPSKGES